MSDVKVMENRIRRTADRMGLEIRKSRASGLWSLDGTGYPNDLDDMTLREVCDFLEATLERFASEREEFESELAENGAETYPLLLG